MQKYDNHCTGEMNWFNHARMACFIFEPEPVNTFQRIEAILTAALKRFLLKLLFANCFISHLLGILIGQTQPEKGEVWGITTQWLDNTGLSTEDIDLH